MIQVKMSFYLNMHDILQLDEVTMHYYTLFFYTNKVLQRHFVTRRWRQNTINCHNQFIMELYNNHSNKRGDIVQI